MAEIKAFNRWTVEGIKVEDPGLVRYINLNPTFVPRTGARYAGNRFHKSRTFIIERLMNKLQNPGHKGKKHFKSSYHCTGKGSTIYKIMEEVLEVIEKKTSKNPIDVIVKAIENGAPREEIIMIEYGGARYPKPVECSPQRRIDFVLRLLVQGSYQKSFNSKKSIVDTLSSEIIAAYNKSSNALVISKKNEIERQADSSR
ncbi:30S ribosomal protein S7 [Candidatus Woesearchaeota archaeon]|nr:30S ribosomal protein S7 [Candidatus Woesearchaeota archaeon]